MKVWKRVITSLSRNVSHALILFLIVFVLGNVLFASIAVSQTSNQVDIQMKNRIPSCITIEENKDRIVAPYFHSVLNDLLKDIENDEDVQNIVQINHLNIRETVYYDGQKFNAFMSYLNVNDYETLTQGIQLVEGKNFEKSDIEDGKYKIILDEIFRNEYKLGDIYTIELLDYLVLDDNPDMPTFKTIVGKKYDFEIIGFTSGFNYENKGVEYHGSSVMIIPSVLANEIYQTHQEMLDAHPMNENNLYRKYLQDTDSLDSEIRVEKAFVYVKGMEAVDRVEPKIKKDERYDNVSFVMRSSSQDYRYIQAPLENLKALANVTMWASIVLVVTLLSLVSSLFIRNRKQEIGILMALGESKLKLMLQFVCEIILVGLLATSISMVSGNKLGSFISNEFMKIQIDTEAELEYKENNKGELTQLDMLETYEVKLDAQYIVTIYVISFVVLFVSTVLPMIFITRIDPKKVLLS